MRIKLVGIIIILSILAALFAGCATTTTTPVNTTGTTAKSTANPSQGSVGTTTAGMNKDAVIRIICRSLGSGDPANNDILNELKNRIPFKFTVELKSSVDYPQQCQVILASSSYPDMMEFWSTSYPNELMQLSEDKIILALDELLKKYGSNILANRPETTSTWFRGADGKTYTIPCRQLEMVTNDCFVIRKDWLKKVGLPVPDNTQQLYDALKAFKEKDPDGNGKNDTIPLSGVSQLDPALKYVASEFGVVYGDWNLVDGKLVYYAVRPEFKQAVAFARKLYQEGLYDNEFPVMNREQFFEKMYQNIVGVHNWYIDQLDKNTGSWISTFYSSVPEGAEYALMNFFPNQKGIRRGYTGLQNQELIVFANSKFPDACVQYADYLMSEAGSRLVELGIEGKHWDLVSGQPVPRKLTDKDKQSMGFWMYNWMAKRTYLSPGVPKNVLDQANIYKPAMVPTPLYLTTAAEREYNTGLNDLRNSSLMSMIVDKNVDLDTAFDAFVKKWYAQGGDKVTTERNAALQKK